MARYSNEMYCYAKATWSSARCGIAEVKFGMVMYRNAMTKSRRAKHGNGVVNYDKKGGRVMQLSIRPESIVTDLSSFFDMNDLYITFKLSQKDAVILKRMGFNVRDYGENNKVIRIKMVSLEHSRGFGIYINNKLSTPADLFYTKDLEIDELIVIPRGPIPTYNGKTFFMLYLMVLKTHSVKRRK